MKRFFIAASVLLITGSLQAQTTKEDTKTFHHKDIRGNKPHANIQLSDEQKAKTKALNEDYRRQITDLRKNTTMSVGDYRTKVEALRKEQHEKMQAMLTPEQKSQIATQRKESQQKMKDVQAKRVEKMKSQLGLTDEQAKKMKDNQAASQQKLKAIREDKTLTENQKKDQARAIMKEQREQWKTILTPDQLQKMKSGRKNKTAQTEK